MGILYHGSKEHGLIKLTPHKSTHGTYVYATPDKVLALIFGKKCGDDLVYSIGHFNVDRNSPWQLIENIPGAFDKMFSNSCSVYTVPDDTFKDIHTGFREVVSEEEVSIINEEIYDNIYEGLLKAQEDGLVEIYRYPNKPITLPQDGSHILDQEKKFAEKYNVKYDKHKFDRLVYLHPELLEKINVLIKELGYDIQYQPNDLVELFKERIERQLLDSNKEQYIDSAYISICETYPDIAPEIDKLYQYYKENVVTSHLHK